MNADTPREIEIKRSHWRPGFIVSLNDISQFEQAVIVFRNCNFISNESYFSQEDKTFHFKQAGNQSIFASELYKNKIYSTLSGGTKIRC